MVLVGVAEGTELLRRQGDVHVQMVDAGRDVEVGDEIIKLQGPAQCGYGVA